MNRMSMPTQSEKGHAFRALHLRDEAFIIPNPWDAGTAKLLAHLGFEALATTSAGYAFSAGKPDNAVDRAQMMTHLAALAETTSLPVSADLANGFGDAPKTVAETIALAAAAGVVGGSIEDATQRTEQPIYDLSLAVERIQAAVEAVRALPFPFVLTARCENYLWGRPDLGDTIARLQAYQEAGADVLYAPGLTGKEGVMLIVEYAPGGSSAKHRHNAHAFVYVLEGSIVMQVEGGTAVTLGPGQTFYESPDDVHAVSKNASDSRPAKFVVFFVKDKGAPPVVPVP